MYTETILMDKIGDKSFRWNLAVFSSHILVLALAYETWRNTFLLPTSISFESAGKQLTDKWVPNGRFNENRSVVF